MTTPRPSKPERMRCHHFTSSSARYGSQNVSRWKRSGPRSRISRHVVMTVQEAENDVKERRNMPDGQLMSNRLPRSERANELAPATEPANADASHHVKR